MDIKITLPRYETTLPSSGKKVSFRPYTVAEEKIFLVADETGTPEDRYSALKQVIANCTDGVCDVGVLPICDTEWLVAMIRAKSKGEALRVSGCCNACGEWSELVFDLRGIEATKPTDKIEKKIEIADGVGVIMRFPTYSMFVDETKTATERSFAVVVDCVESIFSPTSVYDTKDMKREEVVEFIESLPLDGFEKVRSFFDSMPVVQGNINWTCKCGAANTTEVSGLHNFFG